MPQVLTRVAGRPPLVGGTLADYVASGLNQLAGSLELTTPAERERAIHWAVLGLLAVGAAIVRFWGLASVGLHGDEETMAMAVRGIVEHGAPVLPSGMFYPRGLLQLALMSLSVLAFGESEWALRLPSVICGVLLVPIGYFAGRRFLRPAWALALAATLAFLPDLIVYSQTARMYIFLVMFIAIEMVCMFTWERTGKLGWLAAAVAALVLGLDMHSLAVACVPLLLLPGALQGDRRKLASGALAMLVVGLSFVAIESFVAAQYPIPPSDIFGGAASDSYGPSVAPVLSLGIRVAFVFAGTVLAAIALRAAYGRTISRAAVLGIGALIAGIALQLVFFYHLAALCYVAGIVLTVRVGAFEDSKWLLIVLGGVACIAIAHVVVMAPQAGSVIRLVGALNGQPSAWPYVRFADYSVFAAAVGVGLLGRSLYLVARGVRVPDYAVLLLLGGWAPLFALGLFAWDVPTRYTAASLLPVLVAVFAYLQALERKAAERWEVQRKPLFEATCAALAGMCMIDPVDAATTINAGYGVYPDHKGAAAFMRAQDLKDDDIVLAEDVLQQTYYLGRVDYWLIGPQVARRFVIRSDRGIVDFYTGTPVIFTTEMLDELLQRASDKRIFVIGSGEGWEHGYRDVRGKLHGVLESKRFATKFVGRDGLTRVLQAVPQAAAASGPSEAEAQALPNEAAQVAVPASEPPPVAP
jgi:hypothetical protein